MQAYTNGHGSHAMGPTHGHMSYDSSSEGSHYGHTGIHSRSESGTSQTQYDDPYATPSPKALVQEYTQPKLVMNGFRPPSQGAPRSLRVRQSDAMAMHLLLETALGDSQNYDILSPEELDELKKEEQELSRKIQARRKKLFLESRMHATTRSLQRLDSRTGVGNAPEEPPVTSEKCAELADELWRLERRQTELEDRRLKHTAGVLQMNHELQAQKDTSKDMDDEDEIANSFLAPRLRDLSRTLYEIIGSSKINANFPGPPPPGTSLRDEVGYIEQSLFTVRGLHDGLRSYVDDTRQKGLGQTQGPSSKEATAALAGLWEVVGTNAQEVDQSKRALRAIAATSRGIHDDDDEPEPAPEPLIHDPSEPFSVPALTTKVQALCDHAANLSTQHVSLQLQLNEEREALQSQLSEKSRALTTAEADRGQIESELVRLQTELTISRAELDGAYGTRAQRALGNSLGPKDIDDLTSRNAALEQELGELVNAHEGMVRQLLEAERQRETLETLGDTHRERIEELELAASHDRLRTMGRDGVAGDASPGSAVSPDKTSVGVMRQEFKKMVKELRASHFRNLKAEQEERRRLEAVVRSLRKEQSQPQPSPLSSTTSSTAPLSINSSSYSNAAPTGLVPPSSPLGKSGLSKSVSASSP